MEYITVGVVANTHGLRGDLRVLPRTDFPKKRFRKGSKLLVRRPSEPPFAAVEVEEAKPHKQFWLIRFAGMPTISDVERLKGMELCVEASELGTLPEGTYYVHQLIGLAVTTEDGQVLGTIHDVLSPGANDVYVVRQPGRREDLLLPAIPDCILQVDLDQGVMRVHLLPGLIDDADSSNS